MLKQFSFKNYASFKDEVVFDMTAIPAYKEHDYNLIHLENGEKYLKVAAIYGANGSGKSNFMAAVQALNWIVRLSFGSDDSETRGRGKPLLARFYEPFLFASGESETDTEFEVVHILKDVELTYGFAYNSRRITGEWLYTKKLNTKAKRTTVIFERDESAITIGSSVRAETEKYVADIDDAVLVLSFFNKIRLNHPIFKDAYWAIVYGAFPLCGVVDDSSENNLDFIKLRILKETEKNLALLDQLGEFLQKIDVGISHLSVDRKLDALYTHHFGDEKEDYKTPIEKESSGTQRALLLYYFMRIAIMPPGGSIFVDELESRLHPLLTKTLIDLFYEQDNGAQLVYTTHDTTFFDKKYFRRDQIWFTNKEADGCSRLYALSDFKIRSDASFTKDYLGGIYDGIPNIDSSILSSGGKD